MLRGFLNSLSNKNPDIVNKLLDECVTDTILGKVFPILQTSILLNDKAVDRIQLSIEKEISPIWQYNNLAYGLNHKPLSDKNLCDIIRLLCSKNDGESVAIEILHMRLHKNPDETLIVSDSIKKLGQEILLAHKFSRDNQRSAHLDYAMGKIIKACFVDDSSDSAAEMLCIKLAKAFSDYDIYRMDYGRVLEALATIQPIAFLNGFLGNEKEVNHRTTRVLSADDGNHSNSISKIDDALIIKWCEVEPITRYPFIAASIQPYQAGEQDDQLEWTSLAKNIIVNSCEPIVILDEFKSFFRPMSYRGSRADIMRKHLSLFLDLKSHKNPIVAQWADMEAVKFNNEILQEEQFELEDSRASDERFEY